MLDGEDDIDAIISCTPPIARRAVVEAASKRGLPVFVEKPPAFTLDDAIAINSLALETQTPVVVGFMYRCFPIVDRMRQLMEGRVINLVQSSFFCAAATGWDIPAWFYMKDRSGGHILDQAIHSIDLIRYFAGDITHVYTLGNNLVRPKTDTFTVEDSSSTLMRFASGASGSHLHSWANPEFIVSLALIGEDYHLKLSLDQHLSGYVGDQKIDESLDANPPETSHHFEEMRVFLDAVRSRDFHAPLALPRRRQIARNGGCHEPKHRKRAGRKGLSRLLNFSRPQITLGETPRRGNAYCFAAFRLDQIFHVTSFTTGQSASGHSDSTLRERSGIIAVRRAPCVPFCFHSV